MTIQKRIDALRVQEVVVRDNTVTLTLRMAADRAITANERLIREAAKTGDETAQAFLASRKPCCDGNDPACPTHGVAASNDRRSSLYRRNTR